MIKVTCALIINTGKILITQRGANSDHPFQWEFPGGKVNGGETFRECLVREIKEELNMEVEIEKELVAVEYDYGFRKIKLIPFLCTSSTRELLLNEHNDFKWINWTELDYINFSEADKKLIQQEENREILKKYFGENMHNTR